MKLYTEEQVKEMLNKINAVLPKRASLLIYMIENITEYMNPIELPSDEDIEQYATFAFPDAEKIGGETYTAYRGMKIGAKWIKEQILNQNK